MLSIFSLFIVFFFFFFFFSSRRRHTRWNCDWSSDVCSSDLGGVSRVPTDSRRRVPYLLSPPIDVPSISMCRERSRSGGSRSEERRVGKECRSRWSPDQ